MKTEYLLKRKLVAFSSIQYDEVQYKMQCAPAEARLVPVVLYRPKVPEDSIPGGQKKKPNYIVYKNMLGKTTRERTILNISRNSYPVRPTSPPTTKGTLAYVNEKVGR